MCDAVIESMLQCSLFINYSSLNIYFSFFYLNSLRFTVSALQSVITVLLISDLGVICLLEKCQATLLKVLLL